MEKLSNYSLKFILISLLIISIFSCKKSPTLYQKKWSAEEELTLSKQLENCIFNAYYQGSPGEMAVIKEVLKLDPKNPDFWREAGIPFLKRGMAHEFYAPYQKAVELNAEQWQGWRGYIYLYFYRDYQRALTDFIEVDATTPDFVDYPQSQSVYFMRAICYLKMNDYDNAIKYMDMHIAEELKTVSEDYLDTRNFLFKGIALYKKGDINQAATSFKRGLKNADDKSADLWYWLGKMYLEQNEKQLALDAFKNAQKQYDAGYFHSRPYVAEFFQTYPPMIEAGIIEANQM